MNEGKSSGGQVRKANKRTGVVTLSIGVACLLIALALGFNVGGLADAVPTVAKAVWGFAGCAAALLVCGIAALLHKPTPQELVSQGDERNKTIGALASTRAFELFSILIPIVALGLYSFDQVTLVGMLVLIGVEVVAFVAYLIWIARIQRSM